MGSLHGDPKPSGAGERMSLSSQGSAGGCAAVRKRQHSEAPVRGARGAAGGQQKAASPNAGRRVEGRRAEKWVEGCGSSCCFSCSAGVEMTLQASGMVQREGEHVVPKLWAEAGSR